MGINIIESCRCCKGMDVLFNSQVMQTFDSFLIVSDQPLEGCGRGAPLNCDPSVDVAVTLILLFFIPPLQIPNIFPPHGVKSLHFS